MATSDPSVVPIQNNDNPSDKPGQFSLDLLPGAAEVAGGAMGLGGNIIGAGITALNAPLEILTGEIGEFRLNQAIKYGSATMDPRYINMVLVDGKSVSEVADIMADEGVAVTGGVPYDLALSVFLDPFNLIAMGYGAAHGAAKRSGNIQKQFTRSAENTVYDSAIKGGVPQADAEWLARGRGRQILGRSYNRAASGLSGIKRAAAHSIFGRGAGYAAAAVGVRLLKVIVEAGTAAGFADEIDEAIGIGLHNITMQSASDLVVRRTFGEQRALAMQKAEIISRSKGVNDVERKAEFARASTFGDASSSANQTMLDAEWDMLNKEFRSTGRTEGIVRTILERDTIGALSERIGKNRALEVVSNMRMTDEVAVRASVEASKQSYVSELYWLLQRGITDTEKIGLAKVEVLENLTPVVGSDAANQIWGSIARDIAKNGGDSLVTALADAIYTTSVVRLGSAAKVFGIAKQGMAQRIASAGVDKVRSALGPLADRILQADRWSIVAKDTITNVDVARIKTILSSDLADTEKATALVQEMNAFAYTRSIYNPAEINQLAKTDPTGMVESVRRTFDDIPEDAFVLEVPIDNFKGADAVIPELAVMRKVKDMGYRLIYEPVDIISRTKTASADIISRDVSRFNIDMWLPITADKMDTALGNRNRFGNAIDWLNTNRSSTMQVANTLTRMQEWAVSNAIPLSRNDIRSLHRALTDKAFESGGSIRTALDDAEGNRGGIGAILDNLVANATKRSQASGLELAEMVKNGKLRKMVFWAAEGDLSKVGFTTKATGMYKSSSKWGSKLLTTLADDLYPKLKFRLNPLFAAQEVIESKYWNLMRGYHDERKLTLPFIGSEFRFGTKRKYEVVVNPVTGEKETLDALDIISSTIVNDRQEIKFAQEMAAANIFYSGSATEAVLRYGKDSDGFAAALSGFLSRKIAPVKNLDYQKYVAAEGLEAITDGLAGRMEQIAPVQWNTWLAASGGNKRGAALLFLRERQQLNKSASTARAYLAGQRHYGIGFGRQYDDEPVKRFDALMRDQFKGVMNLPPDQRAKALRGISDQLSLIHADMVPIGYSGDTLQAVREASSEVSKLGDNLRLTKANAKPGAGKRAFDSAVQKLNDARGAARKEFQTAVARKKFVTQTLIESGLSKPQATEMAALFVVAERRSEMLPAISGRLNDIMANGGKFDPEEVLRMKDQLHRIRYARTEEETLYNALDYALNSAAKNADNTHFFNPNRGFLERSINHPVFALYPTSYMFGKVLPEYARALFYTPSGGLTGLVLAPYKRIIRNVGRLFGQKIPDEAWGKFAPLVGYQAVSKIRQSIAEGTNENGDEIDPLSYLLLYTLIPGLPTDIGVTAPVWARRGFEKAQQGMEGDGFDPLAVAGSIATGAGEQIAGTVGLGRGVKTVGSVLNQVSNASEESGSIVDAAGSAIQGWVESLTDVLTNDGKLGE